MSSNCAFIYDECQIFDACLDGDVAAVKKGIAAGRDAPPSAGLVRIHDVALLAATSAVSAAGHPRSSSCIYFPAHGASTCLPCASAGANIERLDRGSSTPLYGAAWQGQLAVVQLLLKAGAKVNARSPVVR